MRWRLYIFFLSVTAAFCFMLLTAVTDYGSTGGHQPPLVSAARAGAGSLVSMVAPAPGPVSAPAARTAAPEALQRFDPEFRPNTPQLFVAHNADLLLDRQETERAERTSRARIPSRHRLRLDGEGWFREELALVTAYCPCPKCCGSQAHGITSIGKNAWTPGLAADPIYLDYGTKVFVPGYGQSVIDDTGGAMRRHWRQNGVLHIDVRMTYHYEARQWGKQYLLVKIYDED